MMIFLIDYDPHEGRVRELRRFSDAQRCEAIEARLQIELAHFREGKTREVVLLEAADESTIRRTHRRYFETVQELAKTPTS